MARSGISMESAIVLGKPWRISSTHVIKSPTVREVIEYGQADYFKLVGFLTAISSDCKAALYDMGLDWCEVNDIAMFVLTTRSLTSEDSGILIEPAIDFTSLDMYTSDTGDIQLRDAQGNVVIDEAVRMNISKFLCTLHSLVKKPEFPSNEFARQMLLEESREEAARAASQASKDVLTSLISFVANAPGSKYDYSTCLDLPISTFMDSVGRLQIIIDSMALRQACYGGMIDASKVDKKQLNMFRDIEPPKPKSVLNEK